MIIIRSTKNLTLVNRYLKGILPRRSLLRGSNLKFRLSPVTKVAKVITIQAVLFASKDNVQNNFDLFNKLRMIEIPDSTVHVLKQVAIAGQDNLHNTC